MQLQGIGCPLVVDGDQSCRLKSMTASCLLVNSESAAQGQDRLQFLRRLRLPDSELGAFWTSVVFAGVTRSAPAQHPTSGTTGTMWRRLRAASWLTSSDALQSLFGGTMLAG